MSSFSIEGKQIVIDENGLDARRRSLLEFATDLMTPLPGSRPATPDAEGIIRREIAPDVSPALIQKLAELADGEVQLAL
jgi:hypothetical protein